ncbi:NAD(P)-dependent oxidoreductase [Mycolicibacterium sp. CBM1]
MRVGFIGLGSQGAPMARRIVEAGYPTTLWARRAASVEPFADTAAVVAASPAELAADSDLVCLCVVGDDDVMSVAAGAGGVLDGLAAGGVIAVHATVHPETCRKLAQQAAQRGVAVVDAPVSGGGPAAQAGTLLVMVGGEDEVVERMRPVFATYGDPIVHLGGVGAGQVAKLLNNLMFTANLATAATTLRLGEELGVSPQKLAEIISKGSAGSFALNVVAGRGGDLGELGKLAGPLLQKDVRLVADIAEQAGAQPGAVLDAADATLRLMDTPR